MGDFIINDPESTDVRTHLFDKYKAIERLYVVRPH